MGSIARLFSANIAMLAVQLKVVRCGEPQEHQTREPPLLHQVLNLREEGSPFSPFLPFACRTPWRLPILTFDT